MKRLTTIALTAALAVLTTTNVWADGARRHTTPPSETILHAWSWSFDTIASHMAEIADAGYSMVQTSPAQQCYVGEDGGMELFGKGKWYYHYQPTDWQVGNYQLGDRQQFRALADSARKYGVRLIVDVLPNHTAVDTSAVSDNLRRAVGGIQNLYHEHGLEACRDFDDRGQCTLMGLGTLGDVNTENPDFQYYYMQYVNDLINLGARGFRYDTAKHIGLPSDPVDAQATENDFWPIFTGQRGVKGLTMMMPDSLFIYGEVLQAPNVKEEEYVQYVDLTASNYGHALRHALDEGRFDAEQLRDWRIPVSPDNIVTWVESHDTYCNEHESAHLTDDQIRAGWVLIAAREGGRPLFYSRPAGSTRDNYWGNNRIGASGNDQWHHPEVVAINKLRKQVAGQPERLSSANDGAVAVIERGDNALVLINFTDKPQKVSIPTAWTSKTLTDAVHDNTFTLKKDRLQGTLQPWASYILTR